MKSNKPPNKPPPDPEITRSGFPELTRCEHCGRLDGGTRVTALRDDHPADGWRWLHEACAKTFRPLGIETVMDRGRLLGHVMQEPDGRWSAYRRHPSRPWFLGTADNRLAAMSLLSHVLSSNRTATAHVRRRP